MSDTGLRKTLNQMFQILALLLLRSKLVLYFNWVAYKARDARKISLQWNNEILPPFFVLNQAVLEKGSQCQTFISKVMYGWRIYLNCIGKHSAAVRLKIRKKGKVIRSERVNVEI